MMSRGSTLPSGPVRWPDSMGWAISMRISTMSPRFALAGASISVRAISRFLDAAGQGDDHGGLRRPVRAVAHARHGDERLRGGQADSRRHGRTPAARREVEYRHVALRVARIEDGDGADMVCRGHRALGADGEGHGVACLLYTSDAA